MIPVIIAVILLVALVIAKTAHAAVLDDLNRKQAETSKIKTQLQLVEEKKETLETSVKKLEVENADLKAKRQAKLDQAKQLQEQRQQTPTISRKSVPVSGACSEWLAQAGVTDTDNAIWLINRESGCNPNSVNRSSGACGIGQQLPCGKWAHAWNDPVGSIIDMQGYVFSTYGSWANAVAHSQAVGWY